MKRLGVLENTLLSLLTPFKVIEKNRSLIQCMRHTGVVIHDDIVSSRIHAHPII